LLDDGYNAFTYLIMNNKAFDLQREFLPVLVEAAKNNQIKRQVIASVVDNIRVGVGLPQIFGTQATIRNEVIYLYPLLNEQKVDEWRKLYDLPKLAFQILGISTEENEVVKVDTTLVSLNLRILTKDFQIPKETIFTKDDFVVLEDDTEQEVAFFSTTEQPFNLILILDFSASTKQNQGTIKKAAQRFVDYARPNDRIAVIAFANQIKLLSELITDKKRLKKEIDNIDLGGGSPIWDSLKFAYQNIIRKETPEKRNAIVIMTDGQDGSLNTTFADLFETVRNNNTTIFPVYFQPFEDITEYAKKVNRKAYQSLWMLAEESGGQIYKINQFSDLNGVYEQIINELSKVYSLSYEPKNEKRDGSWRKLSVKIKTRTDFVVKTRRGYYAN
jgi:Ca-activated chloride channel homolog